MVYYTIRILLSLSTVLYRTVYRDGDVPSVIRVWAKVSFHVLLSQNKEGYKTRETKGCVANPYIFKPHCPVTVLQRSYLKVTIGI